MKQPHYEVCNDPNCSYCNYRPNVDEDPGDNEQSLSYGTYALRTPGDWSLAPHPYDPGHWLVVCGDKRICAVGSRTVPDDEAVANGLLLRDAPRILEAYLQLREENEELNALFRIQGTRMEAATKMWQEAHPDQPLTYPDLGRLLSWLMSQIPR